MFTWLGRATQNKIRCFCVFFYHLFHIFLDLSPLKENLQALTRHLNTSEPELQVKSGFDNDCEIISFTVIILKIGTPKIIIVTVLKIEQIDFTMQQRDQNMHLGWQTV